MLELTEGRIAIVKVLARKFCRDDSLLREELVSVGNLALCQAAYDYDDTRGTAPETWLYGKVKWAMYDYTNLKRCNHRTRWQRCRQFSQLVPPRFDSMGGVVHRLTWEDGLPSKEQAPSARMESEEAVAGMVAPLGERDRMLFLLVVLDGFMVCEAAKIVGLKPRNAYYRMVICRSVLMKHLQERRHEHQ